MGGVLIFGLVSGCPLLVPKILLSFIINTRHPGAYLVQCVAADGIWGIISHWTTAKPHGRVGSEVSLAVCVVAAARNTWLVIRRSKQHAAEASGSQTYHKSLL